MTATRPSPPSSGPGPGFDRRDFAPPGTRFDEDPPRRPRWHVAVGPWLRPALVILGSVLGAALLAAGVWSLLPDDRASVVPEPTTAGAAGMTPAPSATIAAPPTPAAPTADPDIATAGAEERAVPPSAAAFAVQFANSYLNYDAEHPDIREQELSHYLAEGLDPQLGWSGEGRQVAGNTMPISVTETDGGRIDVLVAAQVTGPQAPRWVHLRVTLAADQLGRLAVVAAPAFVGRPAPGRPDLPAAGAVDQALTDELAEDLRRVMDAYGAQALVKLDGLTAPEVEIRGLDGQFQLVELADLAVLEGGDERTVMVSVVWTSDVTGGTLTQDYELSVRADGDAWLVTAVEAAPAP